MATPAPPARPPRKTPPKAAPPTGSKTKKRSPADKKSWRTRLVSLLRAHATPLLLLVECLSFTVTALIATMALLGLLAARFTGTALFTSLLPFAAAILALVLGGALLFSGWRALRRILQRFHRLLPAAVGTAVMLATGFTISGQQFAETLRHYRTLIGGKEETARQHLAHQVYATYRRFERTGLEAMLARAALYRDDIAAAATACEMETELLLGLAAVESSFLPRRSGDGGQGLFQITRIPETISATVNKQFPKEQRQPDNHRYNAFLGAATLAQYRQEMGGDPFLGLLAYNIGPANGGLRSIMAQYGARDFVTIQPYLHSLPRDYPVKVFAYALAFRVQRREGRLLPYQEGDNARRIQRLGIPGLMKGTRP